MYGEAVRRVTAAASTRPELVRFADVVGRLGRMARHPDVARPTPREPVPDWLADRLVFTAGLSREEVAALDLQQAVDRWTAFMSQPR